MRFMVLLLLLSTTCAQAQPEQVSKFNLEVGIGTDIARLSPLFKNDRSRSVSICYSLADDWGVAFYLSQQDYSLDRLSSDHQGFVGGRAPDFGKTITSFLVGARWYIPSKWKAVHPYFSVLGGYARSTSAAQGYYVVSYVYSDTSLYRIKTGDFYLGLLSSGVQFRPVSFVELFAELQIAIPSSIDLSSGLVAGRVGVGVLF